MNRSLEMESDSISSPPRKRRSWLWLQIAGGLLAFGILFWKLPLKDSWRALQNAHALPLVLAGIALFGVYFWTWVGNAYLVRALGKPQPFAWFFRAILLSQVLGMFAPGKIGDLSIAWFLRKRGLTYGEGLAIGVYYKMVALAATSWLGLSVILQPRGWAELAIFILALPVGLVAVSRTMARWIIPNLPRLMPHSRLVEELQTFSRSWHVLSHWKTTIGSLLLALLKSLIMTTVPWLILRALGHPVAYTTTLALSSLTQLAATIPISPSGLGVRELSGTVLFSKLGGVPWAAAGSMMIVATVMQYAAAAVCYAIGITGAFKRSEETQ